MPVEVLALPDLQTCCHQGPLQPPSGRLKQARIAASSPALLMSGM
jgi:hypothetical protein